MNCTLPKGKGCGCWVACKQDIIGWHLGGQSAKVQYGMIGI
jgi:hypothetical protein